MDFHLGLDPAPLAEKIKMRDKILLSGSCFTEHMGAKLRAHKFRILENPHGILFNPVSIASSIQDYIENKVYAESDLIEEQELWSSWNFHSRFSHADKITAIQLMNDSVSSANIFLKNADWLFLTLGSAFVYQLPDQRIVANCHKSPAVQFQKRLLTAEEILASFEEMLYRLRIFNPALRIIFTISPVRHVRDGLIDNNRSKAVLIQAVHHIVNKFERLFYFPAYELVIDDLRDYRFYAEDMVHPNYQATEYVWQKFADSCIAPDARELMKEINKLNAAKLHLPIHPGSVSHRKFMIKSLEQAYQLSAKYPFLDFTEEIGYFSNEGN